MSGIPVLLLTGFLGSGKTTLLNRLLAHESWRDTAVVINEAGAVGIDHLLVEAGREDVELLEGGCMCCAQRGSLGSAVRALVRRRADEGLGPFRRVVVETSGLADPNPLLQSLIADPGLSRHCRPAGVVTVVDAATARASLAGHAEAMLQVALADLLLITKTDLVGREETEALLADLARLNPEAPTATVRFGAVDPARVWVEDLGLSTDWVFRRRRVASGPASVVATASLAFDGTLTEEDVDRWLERTLAVFGPALLRFKGILDIEGSDRPVVIHGVQHLVHSPGTLSGWPAGPRRNRVVLIGREVDPSLLDDALGRLAELTRPGRPDLAIPCDGARAGPFSRGAHGRAVR